MTAAKPNHRSVEERKPAEKQACIGGGGARHAAEMLRFVKGPDDCVYLDLTQKLEAPGVYLSPTPSAIRTAVETDALTDALGADPLEDRHAFMADIARLLEKSFFARLGIARKAGQAILGRSKTLEAVKAGHAVRLFVATDAGRDSRQALEKMAEKGNIPLEEVGAKHRWERVLQKENATMVAITDEATAAELGALCQAVKAMENHT